MTNQQIDMVQQSWLHIKPVSKQAGLLFYERLFAMAPAIRHLFKPDVTEQANKLMTMLGYVVSKLNNMEDITNEVQQLGARHNMYGAKPEHYDAVGQCLVATLKDGLGNNWDDELEKAWVAAFSILKTAMISAQNGLS
jgi:nitric oxide dioxygenase